MNKNWLPKFVFMTILLPGICHVSSASLEALPQQKKVQKDRKGSTEQETDSKEKGLATIRGSLLLESKIIKDIDWDTIQGTLGQLVALKQPKLPETWADMDNTKRQEWIAQFYESDDGKKLQETNQQALADRHLQEFNIRNNGKFIIYDVPNGQFEMRIVGQKVVEEKTYVLQAYGQFPVGEVDEIDFTNMKLDVLRLIKLGEEAPVISGKTLDGGKISLSDLRGKHVLMAFGLTSNAAFELTTKSLRDVAESKELKGKIELLTVTVDEDLDAVAKFNEKNNVDWSCLNLGSWHQETLDSYGLRSVPSLWLIDPEGKVVLTGRQFLFEVNRTKFPIRQVVEDLLAGRLTIGGEKNEDGPTPTEAGDSNEKAPGKKK